MVSYGRRIVVWSLIFIMNRVDFINVSPWIDNDLDILINLSMLSTPLSSSNLTRSTFLKHLFDVNARIHGLNCHSQRCKFNVIPLIYSTTAITAAWSVYPFNGVKKRRRVHGTMIHKTHIINLRKWFSWSPGKRWIFAESQRTIYHTVYRWQLKYCENTLAVKSRTLSMTTSIVIDVVVVVLVWRTTSWTSPLNSDAARTMQKRGKN